MIIETPTVPLELLHARDCIDKFRNASKGILQKLLREPAKSFTQIDAMLGIRVLEAERYEGISEPLKFYVNAADAYRGFVKDCVKSQLLAADQISLREDDSGFTLIVDKNALTFLRNHERILYTNMEYTTPQNGRA